MWLPLGTTWPLCAAILLSVSALSAESQGQEFVIRTNQLGFLPTEEKEARVLSHRDLRGTRYEVVNGTRKVFEGMIGKSLGSYGKFTYAYRIRFTPVSSPGTFALRVLDQKSLPFAIGPQVYDGIVDSLLLFFRVQRCGDTGPALHQPCHPHDATNLVEGAQLLNRKADVTGGWHDAGDYVKFLNTAAYSAYTLLLAYEFYPEAFDRQGGSEADPAILQEAAVGVRWLMKLNLGGGKLITQVQDLRDHDQGWRLPENDVLSRDRPAFVGKGKNLIGLVSAVMAFAYRTWLSRDRAFADSCLTIAEDLFSRRAEAPDVDASGSGMYRDVRFEGKLALGAVELYLATSNPRYLTEAKELATRAGADFWWSWGDINSYANYRLASVDIGFLKHIATNLSAAERISRENVFGEAATPRWGSANAMLGVALQAVLWKRLTGKSKFDTLALRQRDYVLGTNPWGVSFLANVGKNPARHLHSQIAYFHGGYLPGGLAAGPVTATALRQYAIPFEGKDQYEDFQTDGAVYRDDRMDYVTNEPTITAAATAIFVFGARTTGMMHDKGVIQ
jgi:endoglucanase